MDGALYRLVTVLSLLALAVLVGATAFFGGVVAPAVFGRLPRDLAGQVLAGIFPTYYRLTLVCAVVALATGGVRVRLLQGSRWQWLALALVVVAVVATFFGGWVLEPRLHDLQARIPSFEGPALTPERRAFAQLHGLSMATGLVTLVAATLALISGVLAEPLPPSPQAAAYTTAPPSATTVAVHNPAVADLSTLDL